MEPAVAVDTGEDMMDAQPIMRSFGSSDDIMFLEGQHDPRAQPHGMMICTKPVPDQIIASGSWREATSPEWRDAMQRLEYDIYL
jgi:hypothetical protein